MANRREIAAVTIIAAIVGALAYGWLGALAGAILFGAAYGFVASRDPHRLGAAGAAILLVLIVAAAAQRSLGAVVVLIAIAASIRWFGTVVAAFSVLLLWILSAVIDWVRDFRGDATWGRDIAAAFVFVAIYIAVLLWIDGGGKVRSLARNASARMTPERFGVSRVRTQDSLPGEASPRPGTGVQETALFAGLVISAWVGISAADALFDRSKPLLEDRRPPGNGATGIGLTLSGGGYRAALFHAGVVDQLEDLGMRPQAMATVSGGSIFGTFYALGGGPREFVEAIGHHRMDVKRRLSNLGTLLRLGAATKIPLTEAAILPGAGTTRLGVQSESLDDAFFDAVRFADATPRLRCDLMLCTTDLRQGGAVGITSRTAIERLADPPVLRIVRRNPSATPSTAPSGLPGHQRLSTLVAASGAFPGAFDAHPVFTPSPRAEAVDPALLLEEEHLNLLARAIRRSVRASKGRAPDLILADGGVLDNLGTGLFKAATLEARAGRKELAAFDVPVLIVSDGGALFGDSVPRSTLAQLGRTLDTTYLGSGEASLLSQQPESMTAIVISPSALVPRGGGDPLRDAIANAHPAAIQAMLALLRGWNVRGSRPADLEPYLRHLLRVFRNTSTLEDRLDSTTIEAIYRLGRLATLLETKALIEGRATARSASALKPPRG